MARPKTIRAPTTASLPSNFRIPSTTPSLVKSFGKLSRPALLDLAFQWLDDRNVQSFPPYLERDETENTDDEEAGPYPAEQSIDDVRNAYQDLQDRKGGKREVIDRILEGDWRHGITLRQLAMVDMRYMDDHPSSLRWTALELARIGAEGNNLTTESSTDVSGCIPRIHASTFLKKLQQQVSPLVKAHYHISRSSSLPLTFLRIFVTNSPYQSPHQLPETLTDSSRVIYVAFPDSCPFIYTSIASSGGSKASASANHLVGTDSRSLQRLVRDALPKALSHPQERYTLKQTSLTAKNLQALLALRGPGRSNAANGAFSIFADAVLEGSPLDPRPSNTVKPEEFLDRPVEAPEKDSQDNKNPAQAQKQNKKPNGADDSDPQITKKRKLAIHSRFGTSGSDLSSAPLDRLDVRLLDSPTAADEDTRSEPSHPAVSLTFAGNDVISGIRKLAELGIIDPERMPSWMTGEEAISVAVVHQGKRILKDGG